MSLDDILAKVAQYGAYYVCVTGGEPLAQIATPDLLTRLADAGYSVSLETSGAMPVEGIDARISRIVDIKTPGSGEVMQNRWENLAELTSHDEIKFVLCDRADYEWARNVLRERKATEAFERWAEDVRGRADVELREGALHLLVNVARPT
jgi:7-carboxy-7-deazaguanine synthase